MRPGTPSNCPALLTPEQVAERLAVSVRWVYKHAGKWPFTRKLSRKCLRFDPEGMERWLGVARQAPR